MGAVDAAIVDLRAARQKQNMQEADFPVEGEPTGSKIAVTERRMHISGGGLSD